MSTLSQKLDLAQINRDLKEEQPEEILRWAVKTFGSRFAVQSSMQKTAGVLMHMISRISPETEIIFIDTGVHFAETLEVRDEFIRRFGSNIRTYSPRKSFEEQNQEYGRALHLTDDAEGLPGYRKCCELRKEIPFLEAVRGKFDAVAGGLMRAEGGRRASIEILMEDPRIEGYKVYPLAYWTEEDVEEYTRRHDLPVHALYARGFTSIGCEPCTTAVRPGEGKRAGRWRHIREKSPSPDSPLYCGINREDQQKPRS